MRNRLRPARINVKLLVIGLGGLVVVGAGLVSAYYLRRSLNVSAALREGNAAFARGDWSAASRHYRDYLYRNPENFEILEKYATAQMSIRPLEPGHIKNATTGYRELLRLNPKHDGAFRELSNIYFGIRNYDDLEYIARRRMEAVPSDLSAQIWLARALFEKHRPDEARAVLTPLVTSLESRPDKHPEFADACAILNQITAESRAEDAAAQAEKWLDRAIAYDEKSTEAYIRRARYLRAFKTTDSRLRAEKRKAARADLERAEQLGSSDPRVRLMFAEEWMELGELDRAGQHLAAVDNVSPDTLREYHLDPSHWQMMKFIFDAQLASVRGPTPEDLKRADATLAGLTYRGQRMAVLPVAVRLYAAGNEVEKARACVDEYVDLLKKTEGRQSSDEAVFLQSFVARLEKNPFRVIELLEPYVTSGNYSPLTSSMLAEAYAQTGQTRHAIRVLTAHLSSQPRDFRMTLLLAQQYARLRDWPRALAAAKQAETIEPGNIDAKMGRIEAGVQAAVDSPNGLNRDELAALGRELASLKTTNPNRSDVRELQAMVQSSLDDVAGAEETLRAATRELTEPLRCELQLARLYAASGNVARGIDVCRAALERQPGSAAAWSLLGDLLLANAQAAEARNALTQAIERVAADADKYNLRTQLALLELTQGDRPAAIARLMSLARADPRDARARTLLLRLPEIRADEAQAQKLVDELRGIEGESGVQWRLQQAIIWLAGASWRERHADAETLLKRCIDTEAEWSAPVLVLGESYERLERFDAAEALYRKALVVNSGATDVADRLIALLERQGRLSETRDVLSRLQASPRAMAVRRVRAAVGAGELTTAMQELKLRVASDPRDTDARTMLARLTWQQSRDLHAALAVLDEAPAPARDSLRVLSVRIDLMQEAGKLREARALLDQQVESARSFASVLLRGAFLAQTGDMTAAESDLKSLVELDAANGCQTLGRFYLESERLSDAVTAFEKGLEAGPGNAILQRLLVKALVLRGTDTDRARASQMLAELETRFPTDPDLYAVRAKLLLLENSDASTRKAEELLRKIVDAQPDNADAFLGLMGIAIGRDDFVAAREYGIAAEKANPGNPKLLLARAELERGMNNLQSAVELVQKALRADRDNQQARDYLVELALTTRAPELMKAALSVVNDSLSVKPGDEPLIVAQAKLEFHLGQATTAIERLETYCASTAGRTSVDALIAAADLLRLNGDAVRAADFIDRAAALNADSPDVARARMLLAASQKRYDEVSALAKAHRDKQPRDLPTLMQAATLLAASGEKPRMEEALALFEHAVGLEPRKTDAQLAIALLCFQLGDADRAIDTYRRVLVAEPSNVRALNDLAWVLYSAKRDYYPALELAEKAVKLDPQNVNVRDTRGSILLQIPNRANDAKLDFERCMELTAAGTPQRAKSALQLARALSKLNEPARMRDLLEEARAIDARLSVFKDAEKRELDELKRGLQQ